MRYGEQISSIVKKNDGTRIKNDFDYPQMTRGTAYSLGPGCQTSAVPIKIVL
jgi:hypothetical protein